MDGLCIPLQPIWYGNASGVCTPNGGFAYLATSQKRFVYIPPKVEGMLTKVKCFISPNCIQAIDCDPDWSAETGGERLVTMDTAGHLYLWDIQLQLIVATCRAHNPDYRSAKARGPREREQRRGTMCVLRSRRVLSVVHNRFVLWCTVSHTFTQFGVDSMFEREQIQLLRAAEHSPDLVAVGTGRGLVALIDVQQKCIVHKMRGHDKRITSLEWMALVPTTGDVSAAQKKKPPPPPPIAAASAFGEDRPQLKATTVTQSSQAKSEAKARGALVPIVETDDVFDIYDFDDGADQFGIVSQPTFGTVEEQEAESERLRTLSVEEKSVCNRNFDFVEACQSLKDDILQQTTTKKRDSSEESEDSVSSDFERLQLVSSTCDGDGAVPANVSADGVVSSTVATLANSSDESFVNVVSLEERKPQKPALKVEIETVKKELFLVSASMEPVVWIWDIKTGAAVQKIELKRATKSSGIPDIQTTVCWMDDHTLIANTPNGDVVSYNITMMNNKLVIKPTDVDYEHRMVTAIYKNHTPNGTATAAAAAPIFWSKSIANVIRCSTITAPEPQLLHTICAAGVPQMAVRESPHDPTIVAMAGTGRRLHLLHLSSLAPDQLKLTSFTNRVQAKVLYLAWHPEHENQLAFSTEEGRVGIYDVGKPSNVPNIVKPFTGAPIYQMAWTKVRSGTAADDVALEGSPERWVLFVCAKGKLIYIPESGIQKWEAVEVIEEDDIYSVGSSSEYLALGTNDGSIIVCRPFVRQRILTTRLWTRKLSKRYISELAFSPLKANRLAVASSDRGINVFDCNPVQGSEPLLVCELSGHEGVTMVRWSGERMHALVSAGFDGTVRVWDVLTAECRSLVQFGGVMCSTLFLPTNESYVMAVGMTEMPVHVFDWSQHANGKPDKAAMKQHKSPFHCEHKVARVLETDTAVLAARERRLNRGGGKRGGGGGGPPSSSSAEKRLSGGSGTSAGNLSHSSNEGPDERNRRQLSQHVMREIVDDDDSDVAIISEPVGDVNSGDEEVVGKTKSFNYTTICHLSQKEFNKSAMLMIQQMIAEEPPQTLNLNQRLFGDRAQVREMLQTELQHHRATKTDSVAHVLIPQLCDDLELEINGRIANKSLAERHLAMAPMVSYKYWQHCCTAFFKQSLELGAPLQALPYLLGAKQIDEAIVVLCKGHFFREAWIVAKLNREVGDKLFTFISEQWVSHLVSVGNVEGAAFIAAAAGQRTHAATLLQSRRKQTPELDEMVKVLLLTSED